MNIRARVGAMVAAIVGSASLGLPYGDRGRSFTRRNKVARRKAVTYTQKLRAKFAKNALARYGLDELTPDGRINPAARRAMARARKQERQTPRVFGRKPISKVQPCSVFWSLHTHAARRKHMRGVRGCEQCRTFIRAEAKERGVA